MCPGCLRSKEDDDYVETHCCRCGTEMCCDCFSVGLESDDNHYCKRCVPETGTCECCSEQFLQDDIMGCCRDGECPRNVDALCRRCGEWDEDAEQWRCPSCAEDKEEEEEEEVIRCPDCRKDDE